MKFLVFTDPHLSAYPSKMQEFKSFIQNQESLVDGIICAGDMCSRDVDELEMIFQTIRDVFSKPALVVFGNHDFWDYQHQYSLDEVFFKQEHLCKKYNITHLEKENFETEKSLICGYDGWYASENPSVTVDYDYVPKQNSFGGTAFQVLKKKEMNALYRILDIESPKKKVCVTHFGFGSLRALAQEAKNFEDGSMKVFDGMGEEVSESTPDSEDAYELFNANKKHALFLAEKFSLVVYGHSHKQKEFKIGNCEFVNVGADYNQSPEMFYKIIEIE